MSLAPLKSQKSLKVSGIFLGSDGSKEYMISSSSEKKDSPQVILVAMELPLLLRVSPGYVGERTFELATSKPVICLSEGKKQSRWGDLTTNTAEPQSGVKLTLLSPSEKGGDLFTPLEHQSFIKHLKRAFTGLELVQSTAGKTLCTSKKSGKVNASIEA